MRRIELILVAAIAVLAGGLSLAGAANAAGVGTVTRLQGVASAQTAGKPHQLTQDSPIEMGDRLQTGADARLEIKFIDGTVLTLGEKADFTIDQLTFTAEEGTALLTRNSGAMRLLGGLIMQRPQHKIEIASNAGTIGIRGTEVWGGTIKKGSLLDVYLIEGSVDVRTTAGTVVLDKAGLGTSVTARGGAPAAPAQWAAALRDRALATVKFRP